MVAITARRPRFELGRVVSRTFGTLRRNLLVFGLLGLSVLGLPEAVMNWLISQQFFAHIQGPPVTFAAVLVAAVLGTILQAAIVQGVVLDQEGETADFGRCLSAGLRFLLPLLGTSLLVGLALAAGLLLSGLIASIVPVFGILFVVVYLVLAVIAGLAWIVTVPAIVVERRRIFQAFARSAKLTSNRRWSIFALMAVYFLVALLLAIAASAVGVAAGPLWRLIVGIPVQSTLAGLIGAAGVASIYFELRLIREGARSESLASVFD
jgi:hypothetical protein